MLHCEEVVIPRWEAAVGTEILSLGRPIEMTREGCRALGKCVVLSPCCVKGH